MINYPPARRQLQRDPLPRNPLIIFTPNDESCRITTRAQLGQVFPYPLRLDDEQRETLQMVVAQSSKFLEQVNNPDKNDEHAKIPPKVLAQFRELGAFGALVPERWHGAGLNNTQMARLAELVGASDLGFPLATRAFCCTAPMRRRDKYLPDLATGKNSPVFASLSPTRDRMQIQFELARRNQRERGQNLDQQRRLCGRVHRFCEDTHQTSGRHYQGKSVGIHCGARFGR
ncbi:hypothetical protein niasHT_031522 [Heterodera trifolii]|uniref:Acyl-CoA dehydrogenase/oxidase N-terminal domain-containing protein n=1 Tax=Heterodera trifolii TaxID=157864 RepID=A0ABD2HPJ2_9BILA